MFEKVKQKHVKPRDVLIAAKGIGTSVEFEEHALRTHGQAEVSIATITTKDPDCQNAFDSMIARLQLIIDTLHPTDSAVADIEACHIDDTERVILPAENIKEWASLLFDIVFSTVDGPGDEKQVACSTVAISAGDHLYMVGIDCVSELDSDHDFLQHQYSANLLISHHDVQEESNTTSIFGTI